MKNIIALILVCLAFMTSASGITDAKKRMEKLYNEYRTLAKNNPAVEFRAQDNPTINISFTMTQNIKDEAKKIHYPKGLTVINKRFICPFCHHIHNTENGHCPSCGGYSYIGYGSRRNGGSFCINKKSVAAWYKWKGYYDKIEATQQANAEIDEKYGEYQKAKEEFETLYKEFRLGRSSKSTDSSVEEHGRNMKDRNDDSDAETQPNNSDNKQDVVIPRKKTLRIKKSTLKKLLADGVVENDKLTIVLVDDE